MPVNICVTCTTLGGATHSFRVSKPATISDLRWMVQWRLHIPRSRVNICLRGCILEEATTVVELVDWFIISDLIHPSATIELQAHFDLVISSKPCAGCGEDARKYCGRCKQARYCSEVCQRADWAAHRSICSMAP
jgi:hypothetical protein